jgi:hypothetical protein
VVPRAAVEPARYGIRLEASDVRMNITMQQMVFEARTGACLLQIPRPVSDA